MEQLIYDESKKEFKSLEKEPGFQSDWLGFHRRYIVNVYTLDELAKIKSYVPVYNYPFGDAGLRDKNGNILLLASSVCASIENATRSSYHPLEWFGEVTVVKNGKKYQIIDLKDGSVLAEEDDVIYPLNKEYYSGFCSGWKKYKDIEFYSNYFTVRRNGIDIVTSGLSRIKPKRKDGKLVSVIKEEDDYGTTIEEEFTVEQLDKIYNQKMKALANKESKKVAKSPDKSEEENPKKAKPTSGTGAGLNI